MTRRQLRLPRRPRRPERDERGATAILVSVVGGLVLLVVAAFAIDLGMQRAGRRDMQTVADMVALDLGRLIDGRTRAEIESGSGGEPTALSQLNASVANNSGQTIGDPPTVRAYWVLVAADGSYPEADGVPVQVAAGDVPNGVVVVAGTDVGFAFAGVTGVAGGDVERSAVAIAEESACFSLGSYAARLNTDSSALLSSILEGILGGGVGLDALSYHGIVDADVSLLDIALQLGLGDVDELLSTNVKAGDLLIAAARVLAADGTSNVDVLNRVAARLGGSSISVGDLVSAETGVGAAETATINVLDLLAGTVLIANGTNAISVPGLTANLPLTGTGLTTSFSLIEKARQACGRRGARADTAQLAVSIRGTLASVPSVLGLTTTATTDIAVNAASARGTLTDIVCGSETAADPSGEDVQVTSGVAGASAQVRVSLNGTVTGNGALGGLLGGLSSLLGSVVSVQVSGSVGLRVSTGDPSTVKTAEVRVPNNPTEWGEPIRLGSGDLGLNTASVTADPDPPQLVITARTIGGVTVSLDAGQTQAIITNLTSTVTRRVLNPLVTSLNDNLLNPLFDLLGVQVGGADVFGQRPYCSNPSLVG